MLIGSHISIINAKKIIKIIGRRPNKILLIQSKDFLMVLVARMEK